MKICCVYILFPKLGFEYFISTFTDTVLLEILSLLLVLSILGLLSLLLNLAGAVITVTAFIYLAGLDNTFNLPSHICSFVFEGELSVVRIQMVVT